jgi:hypothetical protein
MSLKKEAKKMVEDHLKVPGYSWDSRWLCPVNNVNGLNFTGKLPIKAPEENSGMGTAGISGPGRVAEYKPVVEESDVLVTVGNIKITRQQLEARKGNLSNRISPYKKSAVALRQLVEEAYLQNKGITDRDGYIYSLDISEEEVRAEYEKGHNKKWGIDGLDLAIPEDEKNGIKRQLQNQKFEKEIDDYLNDLKSQNPEVARILDYEGNRKLEAVSAGSQNEPDNEKENVVEDTSDKKETSGKKKKSLIDYKIEWQMKERLKSELGPSFNDFKKLLGESAEKEENPVISTSPGVFINPRPGSPGSQPPDSGQQLPQPGNSPAPPVASEPARPALSIRREGQDNRVSFTTQPGSRYTIQKSFDLNNNWFDFYTFTATGQKFEFTDAGQMAFYRVKVD